MTQKQTSSALRHITTNATLVAATVLMVMAAPFSMVSAPASANGFDQQKGALEGQINEYQSEVERLGKKVDSLSDALKRLTLERDQVKAQIRLTQVRYNELTKQISATEKQVQDRRDALGVILADMYVADEVTPLEQLASSKGIADYVDKQAFRNSISDQLQLTMKRIDSLRRELENNRDRVKELLNRQKAQERLVADKEKQQRDLIAKTKSQQSAYKKLIDQNRNFLQRMSEQQQEYYRDRQASGSAAAGVIGDIEFSKWSGNTPCGGGYPSKWCSIGQDTVVDNWGLYNRECVSYSAWRAEQMGKFVSNFSGRGNAMDWPDSAVRFSGAKIVDTPKVGDVAIMPAIPGLAPIGHSMNVEKIIDKNTVFISQYNFYGTGEFSTMELKTSGIIFIRFQDR